MAEFWQISGSSFAGCFPMEPPILRSLALQCWGGDFNSTAMALQADGKIVLAGRFSRIHGALRHGLARLNSDGTLDFSFNPTVGIDFPAVGVKIQSDGRIVVSTGKTVRRWFENGQIDPSFSQGNGNIRALDIDASGRIYFNNGGSLFRYGGRFRVIIPAAEIPTVLEKSSTIDSGWVPLQTIPANTPADYPDSNFPSVGNTFYRTRPSP